MGPTLQLNVLSFGRPFCSPSTNPGHGFVDGGDWNFSEATSNQIGGTPKDLFDDKATTWFALKSTLGIFDIFQPCPDLLNCTWDNHWISSSDSDSTNLGRMLKCLDRFYIFNELLHDFPQVHFEILNAQVLLDHLLIKVSLRKSEHQLQPKAFTRCERNNFQVFVSKSSSDQIGLILALSWLVIQPAIFFVGAHEEP